MRYTIDVILYDREPFVESEHPREHGRFAEKGGAKGAPGGARGAHQQTKVVNGERRAANGGALPEHIQRLRLPPAWTDVSYHPDPNADLLATGKDAKGRTQYVYSPKFAASQAEAKYRRTQELDQKFEAMHSANERNRKHNDANTRAHADVMRLIMQTGIRPGSDSDTKAAVKAHGATTLEGRHVHHENGNTSLRFTGKKGVNLNIPITDPETSAMLRKRAQAAGSNGRLFGGVSDKSLLDYTHKLGGAKTKDFRTLVGTRTALQEMQRVPPPTNEKSYKKAVREVATRVAQKLGNTPTIALQSYINPVVFAQWRAAI